MKFSKMHVGERIFLGVLSIVALIVSISLVEKFRLLQNQLGILESAKLNGIVYELKDTQKGTYTVVTKVNQGVYYIHGIHLSWYIDKYNIQVGDSISKNANSDTLSFFKLESGVYKKRCDVTF